MFPTTFNIFQYGFHKLIYTNSKAAWTWNEFEGATLPSFTLLQAFVLETTRRNLKASTVNLYSPRGPSYQEKTIPGDVEKN